MLGWRHRSNSQSEHRDVTLVTRSIPKLKCMNWTSPLVLTLWSWLAGVSRWNPQSRVMKKITGKNSLRSKHIVSKFSNTSILIFYRKLENLYQNCLKISRSYLQYFPTNNPSKSVRVGSGHFRNKFRTWK